MVVGDWVSLFLSQSHTAVLVYAESEFEKSRLLGSDFVSAHLC